MNAGSWKPARKVEISCDLGEARDDPERAVEDALWPLVDAANVACGGHAGDERSMRDAARRARALGTVLGAHPSYPDREGFGRRKIAIERAELEASLAAQIRELAGIAAEEGVRLARVKPHGALYNDAHRDGERAAAIVSALRDVSMEIALVAAPGSALLDAAAEAGLPVIREAFADRRYRADGSLVPRSRADALLLDVDEAAAQAVELVRAGAVRADDGTRVPIAFETLCVHGDMEGAEARVRAIRRALGFLGSLGRAHTEE